MDYWQSLDVHEHADWAAFRASPAEFDMVLLDLLMPGMNGEQTLAALRALRPDVRVLLISGYSEGDILGRLGGEGRLAFLAKPFSREAIERMRSHGSEFGRAERCGIVGPGATRGPHQLIESQ